MKSDTITKTKKCILKKILKLKLKHALWINSAWPLTGRHWDRRHWDSKTTLFLSNKILISRGGECSDERLGYSVADLEGGGTTGVVAVAPVAMSPG